MQSTIELLLNCTQLQHDVPLLCDMLVGTAVRIVVVTTAAVGQDMQPLPLPLMAAAKTAVMVLKNQFAGG